MPLQIGIDTIPAVIQSGQSLSSEVDLGAKTLVGIVMPAAWTPATLTFQATIDGVNWEELTTSAGSPISFTVAAGEFITVDPTLWRAINAIRVRSGSAASPVNQGQLATLELVIRSVD